ncbi:MAG: protein kinase [Planctomycetota bacterium]
MSDFAEAHAHDQELLDEIFERIVERLEDGLPVEISQLVGERMDLLAQVDQLIRLAQQVMVGHSRTLPTVRGFTLLGELGQGGMGSVYLARQERLGGRPVALKVLAPSVALSASARERFRSEAHAIARLRHPNIVAIHDIVHEGGVYAYAMEWVDGKSLLDLIRYLESREPAATIADVRTFLAAPPGALEPGAVATFLCRVGIAIARALEAVHRAGLLHRDVKPANVLLRRDGTPLLSDFGLVRAQVAATLTQAGHFVGTPAYAAPEQLRGSAAALDARTDVYGLGVTLYHALTLRLPFSGGSTADILRKIETGRATPLRRANPRLSADLQTVVAKAMDPEPARRYQTAEELADDLERVLHLQPIHARPAGLVTRAIKLARRNRAGLIAAAAGATLALALAVLFGVYWLVVPRWVDQHVTAARIGVFQPACSDVVTSVLLWGRTKQYQGPVSETYLAEALRHYDRALRLAPLREEIRAERDVIAAALAVCTVGHARGALSPGVRAVAPETARYAGAFRESNATLPRVGPTELQAAATQDLRLLGLLAFAVLDTETALAAWARLDEVGEPDPLVQAALGLLYLAREEPQRAYPRLQDAAQAFPTAGFLNVSLADAALQCGDVNKAEQLLARARLVGGLDTTHGLDRVQADLYAATGRDELAIALWNSPENFQAVARCHYAQYLEAHGDLAGATRLYGHAGGAGSYRRAWDGFRRVAPRWWGGLSDQERWTVLREALDQPLVESGRLSLVTALSCYAQYALLPLLREGKEIPAAPGSLEAIGLGLRAAGGANALTRATRYPAWLKDLHAGVLMSPWPGGGSLALAAIDAVGRRLNVPGWSRAEPPALSDGARHSGP